MSESIRQAEVIGVHDGPTAMPTSEGAPSPSPGRSRFAAVRDSVGAAIGAILGLLPHVMHHIGLLAGAALITGVGGNLAFFAVGLVFSIPLLRRLYRRFQSWWAPTIAVAVFATLFSFSALVIGPAISGGAGADEEPAGPAPSMNHNAHHGG